MNDQPSFPASSDAVSSATPQSFREPAPPSSSIPGAVIGGLVAALLGAAAWALVTDITKFQIGWMAVGVGFLVGYAVRKYGRGSTQIFGIIGAVFALLGCLAGNLFAVIGLAAIQSDVGFFELLSRIPLSALPDIFAETFSPMDILFYAIAVWEGFKFSIAQPKAA